MKRTDLSGDIFTIDDFLSRDECNDYIRLAEGRGFGVAEIGTAGGSAVLPSVRNNDRVIVDSPEIAGVLWERTAPLCPPSVDGRKAVGLNERLRFYRYSTGQRFAPHTDGYYARPNGEQSLLTFMVYLNEDCDGGVTRFLEVPVVVGIGWTRYGELEVRPKAGQALVFRHELYHEGAPVTRGRKFVLRSTSCSNLAMWTGCRFRQTRRRTTGCSGARAHGPERYPRWARARPLNQVLGCPDALGPIRESE